MITTLFILIAGLILNIVYTILAGITYALPTQIYDALQWLFSSVHYLNGIFPVDTLLLAGMTLLTAWGTIYLIKIFLWLLGFIPTVGHKKLPSPTNKK